MFWFAGRNADWIRVDGENFAAAPIERILGRHPDVAAVAVYGVPDPVTGDQVMAAIEMLAGATFDPDAFATFLAEHSATSAPSGRRASCASSTRFPVTGADKIAQAPAARAGLGSGRRRGVVATGTRRRVPSASPTPTPPRSPASSKQHGRTSPNSPDPLKPPTVGTATYAPVA